MNRDLYHYIREECLPTPFCPGCGHGILMNAIVHAIDELMLDMKQIVFVSGIGCAGWIPSPHFRADTLHTTHGRPLAFATGVKLADPNRKVVVISGDGDLASIGGNHLIHTARRDIDLTVICANNNIYGMTGGQTAATTPKGLKTVSSPLGSEFPPFDLCRLVIGAGAGFVARNTVAHPIELTGTVKNALSHKGFSFVDVISPCTTHFSQAVGADSPAEAIKRLRQTTRHVKGDELFTLRADDGITLTGEYSGGTK